MILSTLRRTFQSQPFLSNVFLTTSLFTCADGICQVLENKGLTNFNVRRLTNMTTISALYYGPTYYYYYRLLDRKLPGKSPRIVVTKMLIDQIAFTIPSLALFFVLMGKLEGKTWVESKEEIGLKFIPTYVTSSLFWPLAQSVNFALVPAMYRVFYVGAMTLMWVSFLSYIKNREQLPTFLLRVNQLSQKVTEKFQ